MTKFRLSLLCVVSERKEHSFHDFLYGEISCGGNALKKSILCGLKFSPITFYGKSSAFNVVLINSIFFRNMADLLKGKTLSRKDGSTTKAEELKVRVNLGFNFKR